MGLLTVSTVKNFEFHKSKMADGRHFEKTVKSLYLRNRLTDFDEIWNDDAYLAPYIGKTIRQPPSGKSQKSRYLRNGLTDLYEIWYADAKRVS